MLRELVVSSLPRRAPLFATQRGLVSLQSDRDNGRSGRLPHTNGSVRPKAACAFVAHTVLIFLFLGHAEGIDCTSNFI